jgi:hypothetical protein
MVEYHCYHPEDDNFILHSLDTGKFDETLGKK